MGNVGTGFFDETLVFPDMRLAECITQPITSVFGSSSNVIEKTKTWSRAFWSLFPLL